MDARTLQKGLAVAVPAIVFGFLVAAQWSTLAAPGSRDIGIRYIDPLTATIDGLQGEQTALKAQLADVRGKLDELQKAAARQSGSVKDLAGRIDELKSSAGLTEVSGDGILVTLDATRPAIGAADERRPCFAPDLTDIVNVAWRGGAQAVAINGERVVGSSSVYCVGGTIVVNGSIVSAPFTVSEVGPASAILAAMDDPGQLRDLKRRRDERSIDLRVSHVPLVTVPAYEGPVPVRSAIAR
jgi:uncharacterized protein YlxW (UPF0749 family)